MPMEQQSRGRDLPNVIGHQALVPPPPPPQRSNESSRAHEDVPLVPASPPSSPRNKQGPSRLGDVLSPNGNGNPKVLSESLKSQTSAADSNLRQPGISEFPNTTNLDGLVGGTPQPSTDDVRDNSSAPSCILEAGTKVEYFSDTIGKWIPATVISFKNGHYKLDRKPRAPQSKVRAIASDSSVSAVTSVTRDATDNLPPPPPPEPQPQQQPAPEKGPVDLIYESAEARASSSLQESALKRLRQWDVDKTGHFTSNQIVHLVREMSIARQEAGAVPEEKMLWDKLSCNKCIWTVLLMLMVWMPMLIASSLSRPILSDDDGILTSKSGKLAATAAVSETHAIGSLLYLPDEKLRLMRDCTFVHRYASHRLHVASVIRSAEGNLIINSPHMSRLKVEKSSQGPRMIFEQDFVGDEVVDMNGGCGFAVMSRASRR